jgi:hypothetical protein
MLGCGMWCNGDLAKERREHGRQATGRAGLKDGAREQRGRVEGGKGRKGLTILKKLQTNQFKFKHTKAMHQHECNNKPL